MIPPYISEGLHRSKINEKYYPVGSITKPNNILTTSSILSL